MKKLKAAHDAETPVGRRFIKVPPPTVHAGVGNALREAYRMDGDTRSITKFEDLLDRLR